MLQNDDNPDDIGQLPVKYVEMYDVETGNWTLMEDMRHRLSCKFVFGLCGYKRQCPQRPLWAIDEV